MNLVIGEISYTNILPLFYYLNRDRLQEIGFTFEPAIPSQLNQEMSEGNIHVGGISSFSYAEHADEYTLLPNLSVSSPRAVGSIFIFSHAPINQLSGKRIALTSSSATSVHLLMIILQEFYGADAIYTTVSPDYDAMMSEYDACLLIGDDAIMAHMYKQNHSYIYDLGEEWHKWTGYPMTYAVIAVRNEILRSYPDAMLELTEQITKSKEICRSDGFQRMIASVKQTYSGSETFWHHYFQGLNYDLSDQHLAGLLYYFELAYKYGLLQEPVRDIAVWQRPASEHIFSLGGSE
ncbi:menaquinone biosynthetic enzyme MqnA/MqnD family protein [Salisediminibacterium halotolerans]|uniref:Chorismate dehydratase n=1 Tax=Salisediminibacterium halotolerans TaxID=517425 RepID=A0A1H9P363_9BACI|nr:menaquinone biosynthesis protein [Salisediminibacterium haloalkalitolerans]SER42561.1 chorismate dehydratase [Salisediminibacterium haloalkalitolerans]